MKKILLLAVVMLGVSSVAFGQYDPGAVNVYSDQSQSSCNFTDAGFMTVYFFHTHTDGATASQFKLELPASGVYNHFGDLWQFQTVIGSSISGVSVAYMVCQGQNNDIYLGSATFGTVTPAGVCEMLSIIPDPGAPSGLVEIIDCTATKYTIPVGGVGRVNSDGSCQCEIVPVQETTWGGIKALYD